MSPDDADSVIAFQRWLDQVEENIDHIAPEQAEVEMIRMLYGAGFHEDARKRAPEGVELPDYPCCYRCMCGRHGECDARACECQH